MKENIVNLQFGTQIKEHLVLYLLINALLDLTIYEPSSRKYTKSFEFLTEETGLLQDLQALAIDEEFTHEIHLIVESYLKDNIPFPTDITEPDNLSHLSLPDLSATQDLIQQLIAKNHNSGYFKAAYRKYAQDEPYYEDHPEHTIEFLYPKLYYAHTIWHCIIQRETSWRSQM